MPLLFAATIFLSAALLFVLEPMFARMVLPMLGGSPAVWNTAMVFFQATLLLGYAYTHWTTRTLTGARGRWIHLGVLLLPLLVLPIGLPHGWTPPTESTPIPWLLGLFAVGIGLPFFAASTSGPLLQRWYSTTRGRSARDPYFLYAASNVGSLLGLVAYPFVIEPRLRLGDQSAMWSVGYGLLILLTAACAWMAGRRRATAPAITSLGAAAATSHQTVAVTPLSWSRRIRWVLLAFVPSSLMLGVTQHLSSEIAAIALFWVLPLAIYLLSFVIVFAPRPLVPWSWIVRAHPIAVIVAMIVILYRPEHPLAGIMALHLLLLLLIALGCHGALARDRPEVSHLTEFFVWLAVGGALGGVFNGLIAPMVFTSVTEYPVAVALAGILTPVLAAPSQSRRDRIADLAVPLVLAAIAGGFVFLTRKFSEFRDLADIRLVPTLLLLTLPPFAKRPLRFGLCVFALWFVGHVEPGQGTTTLFRARTFFGVHRVTFEPERRFHTLFHGTIVHGIQSMDPARRREPLGYYHRGSPLARIFQVFDERNAPLRVGVVGLGAGAIAAYGRPGDDFTFYDIDPTVVQIARDPRCFTYLADSRAQTHVVLGDARRSLEADTTSRYDLLILDAYSSDAVPVHLITREAVALYLRHLAPHGLLAFHISSRHFRLAPVLSVLADDAGLATLIRADPLDDRQVALGMLGTTYVAMARDRADFGGMAGEPAWKPLIHRHGMRPWTDDYSSLFTVLAWR